MLKKFRKPLSIFLVVLMLVTSLPMTVFAQETGDDDVTVLTATQETTTNDDDEAPIVSSGAGICQGAVSWIANRAIQRMTIELVGSDNEVISSVVLALQSPSARSEIQHKTLVKQIAATVEEIKESVDKISKQLNDVLENINNKMDQTATAKNFSDATQTLKNLIDPYMVVWDYYEDYIAANDTLAELMAEYPDDATRTDEQKALIKAAEEDVNLAFSRFINSIEEKGMGFLTDLGQVPKRLWNSDNPSSSYLGSYEEYLRQRYTFEHEITDYLFEAVSSSVDIMDQMFTLYREYYSYKKSVAEAEGDTRTYKTYTDAYFEGVRQSLLEDIDEMVDATGFGTYTLYEQLSQDEIDAAKELDADFELPTTIEFTISIGGTEYEAYRVRDNSTLDYFVIVKDLFTAKELFGNYASIEATYFTTKYKMQILAPDFLRDCKFSDDGRYEIVGTYDELTFISNSWTKISSSLRDNNSCNLVDIPTQAGHILLGDYEYAGFDSVIVEFNISLVNNDNTVSADRSYDLYWDDSMDDILLVYREIDNDYTYTNNTLTYNESSFLEGKPIYVDDGQTLDLSSITTDANNITILVGGSATIVSNPDITLQNSRIIICDTESTDTVTLKNVNIVADESAEAALVINSDCTVRFLGNSTFSGQTSNDYEEEENFYETYTRTRPTMASCGIWSVADVVLTGPNATVEATGTYGGAGICFADGNLTISSFNELDAYGSTYNYVAKFTLGAGIGSCVSFTRYKHYVPSGLQEYWKEDYYYITSNYAVIAASSSGKLVIDDANINAEASEKAIDTVFDTYVEDIGGVGFSVGEYESEKDEKYYFSTSESKISNSSIITNGSISSKIKTAQLDNSFYPEYYTVTAYTKGSNGVTDDGVYFRFCGTYGFTSWIEASDIGNSKGTTTQTISIPGMGSFSYIQVKTVSDNHWYPGEITVTTQFGGESITVYGGRWIGSSSTTLRPSDNVYEITVNTGSVDNSGTDANIYLYLEDEDGTQTSNINLSDIHQDSNAFEKGDSDTFWIYAPSDFGECCHACFYSDDSNLAAGWLLESFTVKKVSGTTADSGFTFTANQWFVEKGTINFGKYSGGTGSFYIKVKTSDKSKAGTDSDIYLKIIGSDGETEEIELDVYAGSSSNNFERGDLDAFYVGCDISGIGEIEAIQIRKNDSGIGPDWHLEYIEITENISDSQTAQTVKFSVNQWIRNSTYTFTNATIITGSASTDIDCPIIDDILVDYEVCESDNLYVQITHNYFVELFEKLANLINWFKEFFMYF